MNTTSCKKAINYNHYSDEDDYQQCDTHAYTLNSQSHLMHVACHAVQVHAVVDHREEKQILELRLPQMMLGWEYYRQYV